MARLLTVWAPGRVNLIGEHTDYSGGLVLPAAIQLGVTVTVEALSDAVVLTSTKLGPGEPFAAGGGGAPVNGWACYGQAVAAELAELGRPAAGLTASIHSTVPTGAGLSSSAALEVGIGLALCAVADFELEPLELALACQRAEFRAVGKPCGILDQAACLLGRPGVAILLDCATLEHRDVHVPDEAALLVVDSGIGHDDADAAYAQRRHELEHALQLAGATHSTDVTPAQLDGLDPISTRRLRHVMTENRRVLDFAAALEERDLAEAGRLLFAGHASLRDDYEVSIAELDLLVELASDAGAYGARLLGGGFGGAVIALVDSARADEIASAVTSAYRERTGRDGRSLTARASAGAEVRR